LERRSAAFPTHHESFLEIMARQECQNFYCMEHNNHINGNNNSSRTQSSNAENDEDGRNEERRRFFVSLEFDSDDNSSSDSEYDTSTEEEVDDNDILEDGNVEEDYASDNQGDTNDQRENRVLGEDDGINEADTAHSIIRGENFEMQQENSNSVPALELPSITYTSNMDATYGTNLNYQRIASLLLSLSNSEEMPLIRADIPWSLIISCGSMPSLLPTLYRQTSDTTGARLLQGVLRSKPSQCPSLSLFSFFHHLSVFLYANQFSGPSIRGSQGIARCFPYFLPRYGRILHSLPVCTPKHIAQIEIN
jgi:hypothetical protein